MICKDIFIVKFLCLHKSWLKWLVFIQDVLIFTFSMKVKEAKL